MIRRPPRSTLTDTLLPYTTFFRSHATEASARVSEIDGSGFTVEFEEPVRAPAPGQAIVLYRGTEVVGGGTRSEEHTYELQSLMRISYAVFCLNIKKETINHEHSMTKHCIQYRYISARVL